MHQWSDFTVHFPFISNGFIALLSQTWFSVGGKRGLKNWKTSDLFYIKQLAFLHKSTMVIMQDPCYFVM